MSHYLLLLTFSWVGGVSLQFIHATDPNGEAYFDTFDPTSNNHPPLPYRTYNAFPPRNLQETEPALESLNAEQGQALVRRRRSIVGESWEQNQIPDQERDSPIIYEGYQAVDENATQMYPFDKRNFSPWGGKRSEIPTIEQMWSWKQGLNAREPSMPKRVRFSPWGGKRSGQMVYKLGQKDPRVIFSTVTPELTRLISNFPPNDQIITISGLRLLPMLDKRHPMNLMTMSTKLDGTALEAMPFNTFLEYLPRLFKVGHPYADISLKKDGKRKVKFSAWGGKRSPPIIGPIWTPAPDDLKASTLNGILLIKGSDRNPGKNEVDNRPE